MTLKELEKVLYFESYVVTDPGKTRRCEYKELLSEETLPQGASRSTATTLRRRAWAPRRSASCSSDIDIEQLRDELRVEMTAGDQRGQAQEDRASASRCVDGVPQLGQPARSG